MSNNKYGSVMAPTVPAEASQYTSSFHTPPKHPFTVSEQNITNQASVVISLFVNNQLLDLRKNSAQNPNSRPLGTAVSAENLAVKEDDLMMIQRNWSEVSRLATGSKASPWTFSSLTGIDTHPDYNFTQEAFEANFMVIGRSQVDYTLANPQQHNRGQISIQIGGSGSIRNNGSTSFNIGELVSWSAYAIDPAKRQAQVAGGVKKGLGEPVHKFSPILERHTYTSMYRYPELALSRYLQMYRCDADYLSTNVKTAINGEFTSTDLLFLATMRNEATYGLMYALSVLIEAEVVTINKLSPVTVQSLSEIKLEDLNAKAFVYQDDGTIAPVNTPKERLERQEENFAQLLNIGKLLGPVPGGQVATGLVDAIICRQNIGMMEGSGTKTHRENANILRVAPAGRRQASDNLLNEQSIDQILQRDQMNYSRSKYAEYHQAYMASQRKVFAKCIGPAEPGQRMPVVFN